MRIFVTGGSGVLGRAVLPRLRAAGHEVEAPARDEVDLFDPDAVARATAGTEVVLHLATRIPAVEDMERREAWHENDRLRRDATRNLVDAALAAGAHTFVLAGVTFVYPREGPADEDTPTGEAREHLRTTLDAEAEVARFAASGGAGVALRLGRLDGPGTFNPEPETSFGASLHVEDAGNALVAALEPPSGIYNVCRDGERISNGRFRRATGWRPER